MRRGHRSRRDSIARQFGSAAIQLKAREKQEVGLIITQGVDPGLFYTYRCWGRELWQEHGRHLISKLQGTPLPSLYITGPGHNTVLTYSSQCAYVAPAGGVINPVVGVDNDGQLVSEIDLDLMAEFPHLQANIAANYRLSVQHHSIEQEWETIENVVACYIREAKTENEAASAWPILQLNRLAAPYKRNVSPKRKHELWGKTAVSYKQQCKAEIPWSQEEITARVIAAQLGA